MLRTRRAFQVWCDFPGVRGVYRAIVECSDHTIHAGRWRALGDRSGSSAGCADPATDILRTGEEIAY
jgi:hypothetical protein